GVQRYSFLACFPAKPREENHHGPRDDILPQYALSCQRPNWSGQYWYPFAEGAAVHLPRVSQNVQRHHRHRLLSAAYGGRDGGARRDLAPPWMPGASVFGPFRVRRADGRGLVDTRRAPGAGRTRVPGRTTTGLGAGTSRGDPRTHKKP